MGLWINGGQTATVDDQGVTLIVKVMTARKMVDFLKRAQVDPTEDEGIDTFETLILEGLAGWSGEGAPEFGPDAVKALSLGAQQRIIKAIITVNSVSEEERGN